MKPGIYELDESAYHADPCPEPSLSSGIAHRLVTQSPAHAWYAHPKLNPQWQAEDSEQFDLGACAHAMLLRVGAPLAVINPEDYKGKRGGIPKGWTNDAIRGARDEARAAGKIPVFAEQAKACTAMASAAREYVASLTDLKLDLTKGAAEKTLIWQEEGGIWCRAKPDWMQDDRAIMLDYKSTAGRALPEAWTRTQLFSMGYDLQAGHYRRGNHMTGGPSMTRQRWLWLVQENYPPYACSMIDATPSTLELGESKWRHALATWRTCMITAQWPAYPNRVASADPNPWDLDRWAGKVLDGGDRRSFDEIIEAAGAL